MAREHAERPDDDELEALMAELQRLYAAGPHDPQSTDPAPVGPGDDLVEAQWHGEILAELVDPANDDPETFAPVAEAYKLDTAAGVRDLIRISSADTAITVLRYVLAHHDPATGERTVAAAIVDGILTRQEWLAAGAAAAPSPDASAD